MKSLLSEARRIPDACHLMLRHALNHGLDLRPIVRELDASICQFGDQANLLLERASSSQIHGQAANNFERAEYSLHDGDVTGGVLSNLIEGFRKALCTAKNVPVTVFPRPHP